MMQSSDNKLMKQMVFIAMAPAIGLGIARLAYALLLPEMRSELAWTYSEAGWMNTINAAGYLIGALMTAPLSKYFSLWRLLQTGVLVSVVAVMVTGSTDKLAALSTFRFVAGVSGAFCFVAGGAIAAALAAKSLQRSGFILSLFYAGPGVGIVLSGLIAPLYIDYFGSEHWGSAWVIIGILALVLAVFFFKAEKPEISLSSQFSVDLPAFNVVRNLPVLIGYLAFGAGYIGYMTFIFAYLKQSGFSGWQLTLFWATIGGASMLSPWVWGKTMVTLRHGRAISLLTLVTLIGAAIPLLSASVWMLFASGAIFGVSFFSVPAATTAFAKRNANATQWPYVIGVFTVAFGTGQVVGPVLTGIISDNSGSLFDGLIWGCCFLGIGVLISLIQKDARVL